ncbi:MAG TPA: uroporphyrinogen decarboxylase [Nocardioidaceae bacterium]|nr:uroporphyrinogen decarboxylase [Nocardioidaceae bacterium]
MSRAAPGPTESRLVRAARGQPVDRVPVWFMRQAGRSLPEYRAAREGVPMLAACARPDLVAEITLQPVRRYGVDAAILFSDIVVPLRACGVDVDIVAGVGPVVASPVRDASAAAALSPLDPAAVDFVAEAVRVVVEELGGTPLIGFAGAPYTLASYLVEGGPSRDHLHTKALMRGEPAVWSALMSRLAAISGCFLRVQAESGAAALQLFDSWAGGLSPDDYRRYVLPYSVEALAAVADLGVPRIHFGVGTGELLADLAAAGAEVVGVDWRVPLDVAAARVGPGVALQGNLDPTAVLAPWPVLERSALDVLRRGSAAPGHIFNLGHGVLPGSDPEVLARLVSLVHEYDGHASPA